MFLEVELFSRHLFVEFKIVVALTIHSQMVEKFVLAENWTTGSFAVMTRFRNNW